MRTSLDCSLVREGLSALEDGETLPPQLSEGELAAHLAGCSRCEGFAIALPLLSAKMRPARQLAALPMAPPPSLSLQPKHEGLLARARFLPAAAAAVALPLVALSGFSHPHLERAKPSGPCTHAIVQQAPAGSQMSATTRLPRRHET